MAEENISSDFIINGRTELRSPHFTDVTLVSKGKYSVVYRAKRNGRWWLLKGVNPECDSALLHEMQEKEYELLLRAQQPGHPSIPKLEGMEEIDEAGLKGTFIVMEWVEGKTLREYLTQESTRGERMQLTMQLIDALSYIHSLGIVHRDLKPENIIIAKQGQQVKVIDFGLADSDSFSVMKGPGGTKDYIAPEQKEAGPADVRNDIYSLGIIMKEMDLGKEEDDILERCTEHIDRRYHTMGELREAIKQKERELWLRRLTRRIALALMALVVAACGFWYWYEHRPQEQVFGNMTNWNYSEANSFQITNEGSHNTMTFIGSGRSEAATCPIFVRKGKRYRISVDYSGPDLNIGSRMDGGFQIFVRNGIPIRAKNNSGVAHSEPFPLNAVEHQKLTVDFTATNDQMYIRINFGWLYDNYKFVMHFDDWTLMQLPDIEGSPVDTSKTIYLKNEQTGLFLKNGFKWDAEVTLATTGLDLDLTRCGKGYFIDTHVIDIADGSDEHFLNDIYYETTGSIYVDIDAQVWYFMKQSDGCYALTTDGKNFLAYSPDSPTLVFTAAPSGHQAHWQLAPNESKQQPAEQVFRDMTKWSFTEDSCFQVTNDGNHNTVAFTGIGGYEPALCPIYVEKGKRYQLSVDYSGPNLDIVNAGDATFQIFVRDDIPRHLKNNSGVAHSKPFPTTAVEHHRMTVDFTATSNQMYIRMNFGWLQNDVRYVMHFDDWTLTPLPDIEGSDINASKTLLLKNKQTGLYLDGGRGNKYNAEAICGTTGLNLDLTKCGRGYVIDTHIFDTYDGYKEHYLNDVFYEANGSVWTNVNAQVWYFLKQSDGSYAMTTDGKNFLANSPDKPTLFLTKDYSSQSAHWQIVPQEQN